IVLTNRGLTAVMLLIITAALVRGLVGETDLAAQRAALEEQNRELEAINEELGQREEEIVRQNEELQSQTEELERQSEELRVTNEELAQRERMLETLLELSRSLHVGLSNDETLTRICETLGQMVNGPNVATAILLDLPS